MTIVPAYAALMALGYIYLSFRVIGLRRARKVAIGSGGDALIERAVRAHGNFAEFAPFALLLLFMLETRGANAVWLHSLCIALIVGRASHAFGLSQPNEDFRFRTAGMVMTFAVLSAAALSLLWLSVARG